MGIFHEVFYRPIFNLLVFLYNIIPGQDIGLAIIALTILIKALLWPLAHKALRSQKALADLQPKVEALKKQYEGAEKKEELARALMALYSKERVSPMSSCLPLLIQLPVFIALYRALSQGLLSNGFEILYPFVSNPGHINTSFFGLLDLKNASPVLAVIAGALQFIQAKMMVSRQQPKGVSGAADEQMLATMNKQMTYMMPALTVLISWKVPGGLALYWCMMNLLTIFQQYLFFRGTPKAPQATAAEPEVLPAK